LTAYSHSTQATDLRLCHTVALTIPMCAPVTEREASGEPARRLDERDIADLDQGQSIAAELGREWAAVKYRENPPNDICSEFED
ncbi:MAG TPA: hypothetical protein VE844_13485, partial [Gammaproteobacteria bacterium]|nr:hypothetical protein [Gammaproteobacteria bacterium]